MTDTTIVLSDVEDMGVYKHLEQCLSSNKLDIFIDVLRSLFKVYGGTMVGQWPYTLRILTQLYPKWCDKISVFIDYDWSLEEAMFVEKYHVFSCYSMCYDKKVKCVEQIKKKYDNNSFMYGYISELHLHNILSMHKVINIIKLACSDDMKLLPSDAINLILDLKVFTPGHGFLIYRIINMNCRDTVLRILKSCNKQDRSFRSLVEYEKWKYPNALVALIDFLGYVPTNFGHRWEYIGRDRFTRSKMDPICMHEIIIRHKDPERLYNERFYAKEIFIKAGFIPDDISKDIAIQHGKDNPHGVLGIRKKFGNVVKYKEEWWSKLRGHLPFPDPLLILVFEFYL